MNADIIQLSSMRTTKQDFVALNERELVSIYALLAYTAHDRQIGEDRIRAIFIARYGVKDVQQIPSSAFDDAIRFLVDFQSDMLSGGPV